MASSEPSSGSAPEGADYATWLGKSELAFDTLEPARSNALEASLGHAGDRAAGDRLPLLHHWLYFWNVQPPRLLGEDGHPGQGGLLPPHPLPRRMWAGGRLRFLQPLKLGDAVSRKSTIRSIDTKQGRSGKLVFLTIVHEIGGSDGLAIVEEQDIVYREPAPSAASAAGACATGQEAPAGSWQEVVDPDPVLLFRYSALTMNGHRIHYDGDYTRNVEGYPGLVVQGPLQATLLAALGQKHAEAEITGFEFKGQSPAFAGAPLVLCGEPSATGANLWSEQNGRKAMVASIAWDRPAAPTSIR